MSITSKISRRKFLYAGAVAGAGLAVAADGLSESNHPLLVRQEITLRRLPKSFDGFTIAHLSDFHYEDHFSVVPIRKSVEMVNGLRPDLTVLTGDFVTVPLFSRQRFLRESAETALPCAVVLEHIQGPKFAILGNHDAITNPPLIIRAFQEHGIPVLRTTSIPLERGSGRIWLAGIDDLLRGTPRIDLTLQGIPPDETTILLAHEPDYADQVSLLPVDLQLSGHSHMGIGTIRAPIRINCPPEVTVITLRSGAADSGNQERSK